MIARAGDGGDGQSAKGEGTPWLYLVSRVPGSPIIRIVHNNDPEGRLRNLRITASDATMFGKCACRRAWESVVRWHAPFSSRLRDFDGLVKRWKDVGGLARRIGQIVQQNPKLNRGSSHLGAASERILKWVRSRSVSQAGGCRMVGRVRGGVAILLGRLIPRTVHQS